jgi:two-component system, cell cycle response regulator DivK
MSIRVLLADGNESLLAEYTEFLARQGVTVATAATGLECIERLRDFHPDVLVLEADLQWGWGEGVLARMFEDSDLPRVPVIVLADPYERNARARLAGFPIQGFYLKPVMPSMLATAIRRITDCPQAPAPVFATCS